MPRKQIYVREEDEKMFERAVELAGEESLSATVAEAVRRFVEQEEAKAKGFGTVVLEVGSGTRTAANWKKVRFQGRLLAQGAQIIQYVKDWMPDGLLVTDTRWGQFLPDCDPVESRERCKHYWTKNTNICRRQVYQTSKGNFLLYTAEYRENGQLGWADYHVADSLEALREHYGVPLELLEMAAGALGEELVEDLDI